MNREKKCHVCGDSASGFNYNGLTCESCKVFFHRYSSKWSELNCTKDGKCAMTKLSRKDCSKCRLEKCFLIGMKRKPVECSNSDREIQNRIEKFLEISILKRITKTDVTDLAEYIKIFPKNRKLVKLNSYELERISEAQNAQNVFPDESAQCTVVGCIYNKDEIYPLIKNSEFYIRKAINFCQNIPAFNSLKPEDQMVVLKPFLFDVLSIRSPFLVDVQARGDKDYKYQDLAEMNKNFVIALHTEMENDIIIRDLLTVLSLFKSYDYISCPEFVQYQYFLYTQLLIRYLEQKYRKKKEAKLKYHRLMNLVSQIPMLRASKKQILDEYDVTQFPPLLMELYDLFDG